MSHEGKRKRYTSVIHHAMKIAERDGSWRCHYCGVETIPPHLEHQYAIRITPDDDGGLIYSFTQEDARRFAMVDHVIPWAKGGTHHLDNLVIACARCNCRKGAKSHDEYMAVIQAVKDA